MSFIMIFVILIVLWGVLTYNKLVTLRGRIDNSWAQIDVQLKRRFNLIPNLVSSVKGYAKHEKETLEEVTASRTKYLSAKTPEEKLEANSGLAGALSRLFAVAENYPDLKANTNFLDLQKQLKDTEDKIGYSRQFYNVSFSCLAYPFTELTRLGIRLNLLFSWTSICAQELSILPLKVTNLL